MARLTLREHETSDPVVLEVAERDELRRLVPDLAVLPVAGAADAYQLRPGSHVGLIRLGEHEIMIQPKIGFDRVLFLASYSARLGDLGAEVVDLAADDEVVEAAALAFARHLDVALQRGPLRGYVALEETLSTVRGRPRFDRLVGRFGLAPPIDVAHDEHTEDIEENRQTRAALVALRRFGVRRPATRRRLHGHLLTLRDVGEARYEGGHFPEVRYTRLNAQYRQAIALARLILRACSFELRRGDIAASAFLLDMNRVFEDFVVAALRDALDLNEASLPQGRPIHLDDSGKVRMKPDVSWWQGRQCRFVGDVKYKRTELGEHADLYQLLAYVVATGLDHGLLIYAAGEGDSSSHTVRRLGTRLDVLTLHLGGAPDAIITEIERIARHVRTLAGAVSNQ